MGTGLAGWHGGIADSYRNNADYLHFIGGQIACHPGKHPDQRTGGPEDNFLTFTVNMLPAAAEHPITAGPADLELTTEHHWVLNDDYIDVLATTTLPAREWEAWNRPVVSPAVWTRQWGKGKTFVAAPGHSVDILRDPNVKTIVEEACCGPAGKFRPDVGIIGCGQIIAAYLVTFPQLDAISLVAVADLDRSRAETVAAQHAGVRALTVDELLADDGVDLVLNLTIPAAHADIALRAIAAGKAVYGEKPLAATTQEARKVLQAAADANVVVGCAPDTVLGTGTQTARKAIDDGLIGAPISATATMVTPGHERWHPNPDF